MGMHSLFFVFALSIFSFEALAQGEDHFNQALANHLAVILCNETSGI